MRWGDEHFILSSWSWFNDIIEWTEFMSHDNRLGNCGTTNSTKEAFWAGGAKNFLKMKKHFRFGTKIFEILRVSAPKAQKFFEVLRIFWTGGAKIGNLKKHLGISQPFVGSICHFELKLPSLLCVFDWRWIKTVGAIRLRWRYFLINRICILFCGCFSWSVRLIFRNKDGFRSRSGTWPIWTRFSYM